MNYRAVDFFSVKFDQCDPVEESRFFSRLKMRNGTFKLTRPSRFRELETVFSPLIRARAPRINSVLDIGVSTGVTTLELKRFLAENGAQARIVATDLFIDAHIVDVGRGLRVLADTEGWPLQYDILGVTFRPWIRRLDYFTLAFAPLVAMRRFTQPRVRARIKAGETRPVQMITRSLGPGDEIAFVENDVLRRSPDFSNKFDIVRAANILNTNYFSADEINRAIGNIVSYMRGPGSMALVTRTSERGQNSASLLELDDTGRFRILSRVGGGSEVETPFLNYRDSGATLIG